MNSVQRHVSVTCIVIIFSRCPRFVRRDLLHDGDGAAEGGRAAQRQGQRGGQEDQQRGRRQDVLRGRQVGLTRKKNKNKNAKGMRRHS